MMDKEQKPSGMFYQKLVEEVNDGIIITQGGKVVFANTKAAELSGWSLKDGLGKPVETFLPPELVDGVTEYAQKVASGEHAPAQYETELLREDGTSLPVEASLRLIECDGRPAVTMVLRDITERKEAEDVIQHRNRELTILSTITGTVSQSLDLDKVINRALDGIQEMLQSDACWLHIANYDNRKLLLKGHRGLTPEIVEEIFAIDFEDSIAGKVFTSGEPALVADIATEPRYTKSAALAAGFRSVVEVPLKTSERGLGVLGILQREQGHFTPDDMSLLTSIANIIAVAMQNAELYRESNEAQELSHGLLDSAGTGIYIVQNGNFQYVNRMFEEISGYTSEELVGTDPLRFVHPEDRETVRKKAIRNLKGQDISPYEYRYIRKDGKVIWILERVVSIQYRGEQVAIGSFMNITERKRAEKDREEVVYSMVRRVKELTTLHEISRVVSGSLELDDILNRALDIIVRTMNVETAAILLADEKRDEMVVRAHRGVSPEYLEQVKRLPIGKGVTGSVAASGKPVVIDNLTEHPRLSTMPLRREGLSSIVAVPLKARAKVVGTLIIATHNSRVFSGEEFNLLITIGETLGLDVRGASLYEDVREKNEQLTAQNEELMGQGEELEIQQRELIEKSREIEQANSAKSEFLANMSHELRTPLNAIIGFSELLIDEIPGSINEEQHQCLDDVLSSGKHLLGLINDVLDISKVESGKMELKMKTVILADIIESVKSTMLPLVKEKNLSLTVEIEEGLSMIYADESKVRQVFLNLLGNAVKFTPDGGKLGIKAVRDDDWCQISVIDNGIGIKEEDKGRIFEPFTQVGDMSAGEKKGTGLGLALTKQIVELHGGR
ncbi:MAG: PAS domain S-box protein, partial [Dehalococcoidia bacterium]|nr:PAS domain S-box protein [Dehalococcoidia bacterium]